MSTMSTIAASGISATTCLRIWGDLRCRAQMSLPEAWGWPGATIEWRLWKFGHGAKEPGRSPPLTAPEQCANDSDGDLTIGRWTAVILSECKPEHQIAAHLRYVNGKCFADIAEQMSEDEPTTVADVERHIEAIKARVKRALAVFVEGAQQVHQTASG